MNLTEKVADALRPFFMGDRHTEAARVAVAVVLEEAFKAVNMAICNETQACQDRVNKALRALKEEA